MVPRGNHLEPFRLIPTCFSVTAPFQTFRTVPILLLFQSSPYQYLCCTCVKPYLVIVNGFVMIGFILPVPSQTITLI